jgi:hypothetical protein
MTHINKYKVKYSYNNGDGIICTKYGCKMSATTPTEQELLQWAEYNTIGGGYDYKILSVSEPY